MHGLLGIGAADYTIAAPPFYTAPSSSTAGARELAQYTLPRLKPVLQVSIYLFQMCALFDDGQVSCFGRARKGSIGADSKQFFPVTTPRAATAIVFSTTDLAVSVTAGYQHSCAVFANGKMRCWGYNAQGQLGDGATTPISWGGTGLAISLAPFVSFATTDQVASVGLGAQNTCALFSNGRARCFGNGVNGVVGLGTTSHWGSTAASSTSVLPFLSFAAMGDPTIQRLSLGQWHVCMVFTGGGVACYGYGVDGELGTDATVTWGSSATSTASTLPFISFSSTHLATDVVAMYQSTCALFNNKKVRCWGRSQEGESGQDSTQVWGDGTNPMSTLPFVKMPPEVLCDEITALSYHACCKTPELKVYCWAAAYDGLDPNGCLTTGSGGGGAIRNMTCARPFVPLKPVYRFQVTLAGTPILSSPEPAMYLRIRSSSTTEAFAASVMTLRTSNSFAFYANGRPYPGPFTIDLSGGKVVPVLLEYAADGADDAGLFVFVCPIGPLNEVAGVYAGGDSTCVLLAPTPGSLSGVKCFGSGQSAQLGQGTTADLGGSPASAVSTIPFIDFGNRDTLDRGELSLGVAVGSLHICYLFNYRHERQNAVCIGDNSRGQTGPSGPSASASDTPASRTNIAQNSFTDLITQMAASQSHTCALYGSQGLVRCWGLNDAGQLGTDSTVTRGEDTDATFSSMPYIALPESDYIMDLATGVDHTCIVYRTGRIRCWGGNTSGQLGVDSTVPFGSGTGALALSSAPLVSFATTHPAQKISAGQFFTCAAFSGLPGAIRCWGSCANGRTGLDRNSGNTCDSPGSSCTSLPFLSFHSSVVGTYPVVPIVGLSAYLAHTCAIFKLPAAELNIQRVLCWGAGSNGKLGRDSNQDFGSGPFPNSLTQVGYIPFPTGDSVIQVATGNDHTCALFVFGGVKCWGLGNRGQLGTGATTAVGDGPGVSSITSVPFIATGGVGLSPGQASRIFVGPNPLRLDAPFSHHQGGVLNFSYRPYKLTFALADGASAGTITSSKIAPSDDYNAKVVVSSLHATVTVKATVLGAYYGATPALTYYRGGAVYWIGSDLTYTFAAGQYSERFVVMVQAASNCNGATAYSLEVRRDPRPQLIGLQVFANVSGALAPLALAPAFSPATTAYTVGVSDRAVGVLVRFSSNPNTTHASGTVNGAILASNTLSAQFPRAPATPVIDVVAYSLAGGPGRYPLTNFTVSFALLSSNCSLSFLNLSIGALAPPFAPAVTSYTVTYASTWPLTSTAVQAVPAVLTTAVAAPAAPVPEGGPPVSVVATAQDGSTCTYTATLYRQSNVSALRNLSDSLGACTSAGPFSPAVTLYALTVPFAAASINVTALGPAGPFSSMAWPLGPLTSGVTSANAALAVGVNDIAVTVTAEDPAFATVYTLRVTRQSNVSELASFAVLDAVAGALAFNATFQAANASAFAATVTRSTNATVYVLLTGIACRSPGLCTVRVNNQAAGASLALSPGLNRLTVVSTAQDPSFQSTYTLDLTLVLLLTATATTTTTTTSLAPLPPSAAPSAAAPAPPVMPPVASAPAPVPGPVLVASSPALLPLAGGNITVQALNLNLSALVAMVLSAPSGSPSPAAPKRLSLQAANGTSSVLSPEGVTVLVSATGNGSVSSFTISVPAVPSASYGSLNVTSLQTLQRAGWAKIVFFTDDCPQPGSYGLGAACRPCPTGGWCPGGNRVWPLAGYWNPDESSGYVTECNPASRCLGGPQSACSPGYKGRLCSECELGWEPLQGLCVKCPPSNARLMVTILGDICVWTVVVLSAWFASSDETYNKVVEVVTVFRSIGQFGALLQSTMPTAILHVFNTLRIFMGDLEITQDRCTGELPSFFSIYMFNVLYCFLVGVGAPVGVLALSSFKSEFMSKYKDSADLRDEMKRRHADRAVRSCQHWAVVVYYILLRNSLQALYCVKVGKAHVLGSRPMYPCFNPPHIVTMILSVAFVCFAIAYPLLWGKWMASRTARERRKVRRRMGVSYESLKPERWWLFTVPYFESASLALTEVFASGAPGISTSIALAVVAAQIVIALTFPFLKKRDSGAALLYLVPMFLLIPASYLSSVHSRHESTVKAMSWTAVGLFVACIAYHLADLVFRSLLSKGGRYGENVLEPAEVVVIDDRSATFEEVEEKARRAHQGVPSAGPGPSIVEASAVAPGGAGPAVSSEGEAAAQGQAGVFSGLMSTIGITQAYDFFANLFSSSGADPALETTAAPAAAPPPAHEATAAAADDAKKKD
jgi:alpha-tubulin suppressor-like RCC1 family protein